MGNANNAPFYVRAMVKDFREGRTVPPSPNMLDKIIRCVDDAEAWQKGQTLLAELQARTMPCGHTMDNLIGGAGSVTKCGECMAKKQKAKAKNDIRPDDPAELAQLVVAELQAHLIWAETYPTRKGEVLVPYKSRTNARAIKAYAVTDPRLAGGPRAIAMAIMDEQRADLAEWAKRRE